MRKSVVVVFRIVDVCLISGVINEFKCIVDLVLNCG